MRNNDRSFFTTFENGLDMVMNIGSFCAAYYLVSVLFEDIPVSLENSKTMTLLFAATLLSSFIYQLFNLNRPIPYINVYYRLSRILFANSTFFGISAIITLIFADDHKLPFLFVWLLFSGIISTSLLIFKKRTIIEIVRLARRQMDLVKKIIIVGDNVETANAFVREIISDSAGGIMILGAVGRKMNNESGCEKLGDFEDLEEILDKHEPDYVVFAIDYYEKDKIIKFVNMCDDRCIKVYFLPVIYGYFKSTKQVEYIGSTPLINVHSTPLDNGVNAFAKRAIDIVGSIALIILTAPLMLVVAIGVKLSSPGPILFRQVRVGKMGKQFRMLKFRSMRVNAEKAKTTWSTGVDERKTKFGNFIRKTSIDELPQLFNVLGGSMSLVGPRPEIPHFVEYFKDKIPLYMVKHYVKPGITGLAQVRGLRGDTSIEERIHADIYYIENWSLLLDVSILIKTPFKAFNKNEKYISPEDQGEQSEE